MDKALENDIKLYMASRIAEEIALSDIQNEVNQKFGQNLTYMDIRILASTLDIDWQAKAAAKAAHYLDLCKIGTVGHHPLLLLWNAKADKQDIGTAFVYFCNN